jgi:heat shock protein HslJ
MRKVLLVALLVGSSLVLSACSGGASALTGKTWELSAITTVAPAFQGVVPAADQANYTLTFNSDGTFSAKADCNQVAGSYTTSGSNGITIVPGPSTLVACPEGSFGGQYVASLSQAKTWSMANNQLTLTLADGGTLVFD